MKNFLKTAPHQHKDPQVRLSFINDVEGQSEEEQDTLALLARDDDDESVRIAAINKLHDLNVLRSLLSVEGDGTSVIADAAQERLMNMINASDVSDIALRIILESHAARLAVPIASQTSDAKQREFALAEISDEASLVTVVQQSRFHDTRLATAKRLTHHDSLRSALAAVRSKDKVVAKLIQQRLDAEAAAEADLIARRHAVSTTLKSVQALLEGVWSPHHAGRLQAAKEKWNALLEGDTKEQQTNFDLAVAEAEARLADYQKAAATEAEPVATQELASSSIDKTQLTSSPATQVSSDATVQEGKTEANQAEEPAHQSAEKPPAVSDPEVLALLQVLKTAGTTNLPGFLAEYEKNAPAVTESGVNSELIKNILAYGHSVAVLFDPPYELTKARPGALQTRIKRVESLAEVDSLLPGVDLSDHLYYQELLSHLDAMKDRLTKAQQESADRIKATHRQFAALSSIIKEGKWGPANSMLRRLQKKLAAMESAERVSLEEKLSRAEKQLAEMADWQDFAARPKLEALCESMEQLPAQELQPEALAKQVRELQNAWKALGVSRASNELWTRFKTAGDTAYEPCKTWFAEKQKERQIKIDAKQALCDKLESQHSLLDDKVDWKSIARLVNTSKRDWSKNRIVDRKPDKQLEERFSAALKPFESGLTEQYQLNAEAKKELVEKAKVLSEGEITQHTANQAKRLLSSWKLVGVMRRKEDQALWEVFNGYLGTVFKHQYQVEKQKQRAELEHVFKAKDIIKKLRQLARSEKSDETRVQQLASEFQALPEFPERDKKFLLKDFRQAMDGCSRVQEHASRRRVQAEHEEVKRLLGLCEQLEWAVESPDDLVDTLVEDVTHAWDTTEVRLNGDMVNTLKKRRDRALKHLSSQTQPDYAKNEEERRNLLIQMEVAAGLETPEEDKARRMQYQLQHLQEGMTAGVSDEKQLLKQLELKWLSLGPSRRQVSDALNSRFLRAYQR